MTITNEQVKKLKGYVYQEFCTDNVNVDENKFDDIYECLDELLSFRQRCAELEQERDAWREDADNLNSILDGFFEAWKEELGKEFRYKGTRLESIIKNHAALVEKYPIKGDENV